MVADSDRPGRGGIARPRQEAERLAPSPGDGACGRPEAGPLIALAPSIRETGDRGLSVDEMVAAAKTLDLTVRRRDLQAQARKARLAGWLIEVEPGRYALAETSGPLIEEAVAAREAGSADDGERAVKKPEPFPPS